MENEKNPGTVREKIVSWKIIVTILWTYQDVVVLWSCRKN